MKKKHVEPESKLAGFYKKYFKKLLLIPLALFLLSFVFISKTVSIDGTPIYRDVSLKGGLSATLELGEFDSSKNFEEALREKFPQNSFVVSDLVKEGRVVGYLVDTDVVEEEFKAYASEFLEVEFTSETYNSNFISPSLSDAFFKQASFVLVISFVLMSLVIFLYFRKFVPSFAVVLSALFDIIVTVGVLDAFGVQISIAGIGALLMLIGYSIDTDVLLTNRLIKEQGDNYFEKTFFAFKTGLLMSLTTLSAGTVALFLTNSGVIFEIALILVVGLLVDFISTWFQNAGILLWWLEDKK